LLYVSKQTSNDDTDRTSYVAGDTTQSRTPPPALYYIAYYLHRFNGMSLLL